MVTERELIQRMREGGRAYLRRTPGAFGGGIDPESGIRFIGGKRVSVLSEQERRRQAADIFAAKAAATKAAAEIRARTAQEAIMIKKRAVNEFLKTIKIGQINAARRVAQRRVIQFERSPEFYRIKSESILGRTGTLTRAMDIGGGQMQDFKITYINGRITSSVPIGIAGKQTKRFKERIIFKKKGGDLRRRIMPRPKIIRLSMIPTIPKGGAKTGFLRAVDFISGGSLTERNLNKRQDKIGDRIRNFNRAFGNRELSQGEFNQANSIAQSIERDEGKLRTDRDNLARSVKSRLAGFLSPFKKRRTAAETEELIKRSQPSIKRNEAIISNAKRDLKKLKNKTGPLVILNRRRLQRVASGLQLEVNRLKIGADPVIFAGEFPIIPAVSIPSGVTKIFFIGTQKKAKGGRIITDIAFKTSKGRIGVAKGISITKGKKTATTVLGRSGKVAFKLPTGKQKIVSIRSFIGKEGAVTKPTRIALKTKFAVTKPVKIALKAKINLLRKAKRAGTITKVKSNIKALQQLGMGRVAGVKGRRFIHPIIRFPSGKIKIIKAKGILFDDFASLSTIFTRKELSLIIGKTITRPGAKSEFIGIIKGTSRVAKSYSVGNKLQYTQALNKVVSTTAAALTQSKKVGGLTKIGTLALAVSNAISIAKAAPKARPVIMKPRMRPITKAKPTPIPARPAPTPKPKAPVTKGVVRRGQTTATPTTATPTTATPKPVIPMPSRSVLRQLTKRQRKALLSQRRKLLQRRRMVLAQEKKILLKQRTRLKQLQGQKARMLQLLKQKLTQKQFAFQASQLLQVQRQINKFLLNMGLPITTTMAGIKKIIRVLKLKFEKKMKAKKKVKKHTGYTSTKAKKKLNILPLTRSRALDLLAYILDKNPAIKGRTTKSLKKVKRSVLQRKLKFVPRGYFTKNRKKFILRRLRKGRETYEMIEKKRFRKDSRRERKPKRRKIVKRRKPIKRRRKK